MDEDLPSSSDTDSVDQYKKSWSNPKVLKQVQYIITSSISLVFCGLFLGYPGILLAQLDEPHSGVNLTMEEASLFASVAQLSSLPASLLAGSLQELLGPRKMILYNLPLLAATFAVISHCVYYPWLLILLRIVQGIIHSFISTAVYVYLCEIPDERRRGVLGSFFDTSYTLGFLLTHAVIGVIPWQYGGYTMVAFSITAVLGIYFCPESPLWLARKDNLQEALRISMDIRCDGDNIKEELILEQARAHEESEISFLTRLRSLSAPRYLIPVIVSFIVLALKESTGQYAVMVFAVQIFKKADTGLSPFLCSIAIGSSRLICNLISMLLLAHIPRKLILSITTLIGGLTSAVLGTYFYLQKVGYDIEIAWMPVMCLVVFMIFYALGIGPISWVMCSEMIPTPVRNIGCGIGMVGFQLMQWAVAFSFEPLKENYGLHSNFWCYAVGSMTLVLVSLVILPETKGKSLIEIEKHWESIEHKYCSCCSKGKYEATKGESEETFDEVKLQFLP